MSQFHLSRKSIHASFKSDFRAYLARQGYGRGGRLLQLPEGHLKTNPWPTYPYQASKAGLIHLTRRMAAELVQHNIIVNGIGPGAVPSAMNTAARNNADMVAKVIPSRGVGVTGAMACAPS